jgi:8-oxo-dGTP diphosphatase
VFTIGAFAIIFDEQGQVLLCHRRDMDLWNLPGGGMENSELPTDAVIREAREETGLEVVIERLVGVYGKPDKEELVFAFTCRIVGGQLSEMDESDACRYFSLEAIPINTPPKHVERIQDALVDGPPIFRVQTALSGRDLFNRLQAGTDSAR